MVMAQGRPEEAQMVGRVRLLFFFWFDIWLQLKLLPSPLKLSYNNLHCSFSLAPTEH